MRTTDFTADGVEIHVGLRVWTNDLRRGTVVKHNGPEGWHEVLEDGATHTRDFNGERMTTRHPFTYEIA